MDPQLSQTMIQINNAEILDNNVKLDKVNAIIIHLLPNNKNKTIEEYLVSSKKSFHYVITPDNTIYSVIPITKGSNCNNLSEYNLLGLKLFTKKYCKNKVNKVSKSPNNASINIAVVLKEDNDITNNTISVLSRLIADLYVSLDLHLLKRKKKSIIFFPEIMPTFRKEKDFVYGKFWKDIPKRIKLMNEINKWIIHYEK